MKFDVIIGNPPYQQKDGGNAASSIPLYHLFVQQAKKLNPKYISMIIPSRWFSGGKGLDDFRKEMLNDKRIRNIVDYPDSADCFDGVSIGGGVCYFLWNRDEEGLCKIKTIIHNQKNEMERNLLEDGIATFIRFNPAVTILHKVKSFQENTFDNLVSSRKPFGLPTNFKDYDNVFDEEKIKIYANKEVGYIHKDKIIHKKEWIEPYKVYISKAYGTLEIPWIVLNKPILGDAHSCCTETYLVIGPFESKSMAENVATYIRTKFFRFLVMLIKNTQDGTKKVYSFVPIQDFSKSWTDQELYQKYNLTKEEIYFIESMVKSM